MPPTLPELYKTKEMRADLPEYTLNSGYFITILHAKLQSSYTTPPPKKPALYAYVGRTGVPKCRGPQIFKK